ncbi:MAG: hypothetical protein JSV05_02115 [Candidatus Bathyarchaeota archaeon]|nr:MAG: hypothetical protein JSV05_02115 [Candidatus Bathyarchaeota archaeon]
MSSNKKERLARIGYYLSVISGLICAFFGMLLLQWLASLLLLGLLIALTALLQRMTYKTLASILTVLFSAIYLILWQLMTSALSIVLSLQYAGYIGALMGLIGGIISLSAIRTLDK